MIISLPAAIPDSTLPLATFIDADVSAGSKSNTFKNVFDALALADGSQDSGDTGQPSDKLPNGTDKKGVAAGSMNTHEALAIVDSAPSPSFNAAMLASLSTAAQADSPALKGDQSSESDDVSGNAEIPANANASTAIGALPTSASPLITALSTTPPSSSGPANNLRQSAILSAASRVSLPRAASYGSPMEDQLVGIPTARLTHESKVQAEASSPMDDAPLSTPSTAAQPPTTQAKAVSGSKQPSTAKTLPAWYGSKISNDASTVEPAQANTVEASTSLSHKTASSQTSAQNTRVQSTAATTASTDPMPATKGAQPTLDISALHFTVSPARPEQAPASVVSALTRPVPAATASKTLSNKTAAQAPVAAPVEASVAAPAQAVTAASTSTAVPTASDAAAPNQPKPSSIAANDGAKQTGASPVSDARAVVEPNTGTSQTASQPAAGSDATSPDAPASVSPGTIVGPRETAAPAEPAPPTATPATPNSAPSNPIAATNTAETSRQAPVSASEISIPAHATLNVTAGAKAALVTKAENFAFAARMAGIESTFETISSSQSDQPATQSSARVNTSNQTLGSTPTTAATPSHTTAASSTNDAAVNDSSMDARQSTSTQAPELDKAPAATESTPPVANVHQSPEVAQQISGPPVLSAPPAGSSSSAAEPSELTQTKLPLSAQETHSLLPEMPKSSTGSEILLHLTDGDQSSAAIRVADRAGAVSVSVHASDPTLRDSLRSNLDDLSTQLNSQGWKADMIKTTAAISHSESPQDGRSGGERSSQQQQQGSGSDRQSRDRRGNPGRWQQEFDQQITRGQAPAGGKA